jgi:hypothetical protein
MHGINEEWRNRVVDNPIKLPAGYKATGSRGSSGSIVSGYRLDGRAIGVRSLPAVKEFFF